MPDGAGSAWRLEQVREQGGASGRPNEQHGPGKPGVSGGMGVTIAVGAGLGLIFGLMLGNLALGLAVGAGLGAVLGAIHEANRRRS